jgi:hypothetical protein
MDIREKDTLTYGEAMLHLSKVFNKETFQKLHAAIRKEIESVQNHCSKLD